MTGDYAGKRYKVLKPDKFFPHDFEVTDETTMCLHLKNGAETYWVTRRRFEAELNKRFQSRER